MGLNVSYNQTLNSGIDRAALKEVTQAIFNRANANSSTNSVLTNADLNKFNRVDLGMDLYNGSVNAATASQVAMTNSGMQVTLSQNAVQSLSFLNAQASMAAVQNAGGKVASTGMETKTVALPKFGQLTETADLGKDKNGSNPFYRGELANVKKEEKEEKINLFA